MPRMTAMLATREGWIYAQLGRVQDCHRAIGYLERPAIGDAASRGWGTHLATLSSVATQHQGDSLLRLAPHAPQPHSLIRIPFGATSGRKTSGGAGFRAENVCQPSTRAGPATHQGVVVPAAAHQGDHPLAPTDPAGVPESCARIDANVGWCG